MKKSLLSNFLKGAALLGITLLSGNVKAQTQLTVDANAAYIGYVNIFENNAGQGYLWGSPWGVADLKTVVNTADNTLSLYPNYNLYGTGDDPTYWTNGDMGNKIVEASTYIEDNNLLGQNIVFSGNVNSNNLAAGYTGTAFIKVLDAGYAMLSYQTAELDAGNFTITTNVADFPAGAHVQYGFAIRGLNGNPAMEAANGKVVVTAGAPVIEEPGNDATIVTVDTAAAQIGYVNVFENNAGQGYLWGSPWGVADLKSVINTTDNQISLYPNYNLYGTGDDPAYWTNGDLGNKILEASTYVEDNSLLGHTITFNGNTISNTLVAGYEALVFIKVMDAGYATLDYVHEPLVAGTAFSVTSHAESFPTAAHIQYGFSVKGLNGNPAMEAANGYAVVGAATAGVKDFSKNTVVMFPNPASNVLNFASENAIDGIQVYNVMGQKVIDAKPAQTNASVDVSGLTNGVYIVNTTINGKQSSARFIKQ
ncbi:hypothetical protein HYN59_16600 [Flavobacterium album]|uniref:Secretion system C-terminal sorting domain-containing protein n=1 Tax=Flavobacterium album TaxID=2175091 RepID=A0A2S1R1S6_9FLAO|nr:T9SS type A sorting domain-containing protein [Flavobacterium album]AWH86628.1 hypothetical protein HYN59_16600 [Flavobacterium album]